jgi:putative protein kinase ArgK-like GTPase of G3E family
MKRAVNKAFVLTVGVVIILIAGCGGGDTSSEIKRGRLIVAKTAAENKQLGKQVEKLEKELEKQKELLAKCLPEEKATEENAKLRQTNEELKDEIKQLEKELEKMRGSKKYKELEKEKAETFLRDLEEIAKVREENENLKTKIMELKKELETHKGPTPLPHTD